MVKSADIDSDDIEFVEESQIVEPSNNDIAEALSSLTSLVGDLNERIKGVEARPASASTLPLAPVPDQALISRLQKGQSVSETKTVDPYPGMGGRGFFPGDVVRITNDEKRINWEAKGGLQPDEQIIGVIQRLAFRRKRDGLRKYKVTIPGLAKKEGAWENEMELLQAAT